MLKMMYESQPLEVQFLAGHIFIILKEDGKDMGFVAFEKTMMALILQKSINYMFCRNAREKDLVKID